MICELTYIFYFQAKDLIQRLYMRLYYISNHRRGKVQTSILSFSPKNNQMDVDKEENR
jgi:hypothetical protein